MNSLADFSNTTIPVLEAEMRRIIQEGLDPQADILKEIFLYHLGMDKDQEARGKRVRPLLVFLITNACQVDWRKAIPAAAAVEFLHNFSLIHDDVEDRSDLRHGRPTVWRKWGAAQAINSGDGMFTLVFQAIHKLSENNTSMMTLAASELLTQTCLRLVEGQILDVSFESQKDISVDDYYRMIDGKTAALLACCTQLGGLVSGVDQSKMDLLKELGYKLGRGFQIQDDLLGIWGKPLETGKPVENDLSNHKHTLPVIFGLLISPRFKDRWIRGKIKPNDITLLAEWLVEDGVFRKVESEIDKLDAEVDELLLKLKFSSVEGLKMLNELVARLRTRNR